MKRPLTNNHAAADELNMMVDSRPCLFFDFMFDRDAGL